ncbi:MAG TPA: hypothetical protein VLX92_25145 [Kofleriaceae bacterium]|nr:hypothetical protein [Kofleriaceae bacterium]
MRVARVVVVSLLALGSAARGDALPKWPEPAPHPGEHGIGKVFPSSVHWLAGDGTPVTFVAVAVPHGKRTQIVLRAVTAAGEQDLATSELPSDSELSVFDHENGTTAGLQIHDYGPHPNRYEGCVVRWTGTKFELVRRTRFNGFEPQPAWLVDSATIKDRERARRAMQTLRYGAYTADNNAFAHFFDGDLVHVTRTTIGRDGKPHAVDVTINGTELLAQLEAAGLPLVGHDASCKALCCTADTRSIASWFHIERVCFDAEPSDFLSFPHVRTLELVEPAP